MSTLTSMPVIVGTAGHVDHGKTTLVQRLTGVDTDRLPEEKQRGITIVLGFAPLTLPGGVRVGLVDVPGHERFVKNMVAGASGVDVALLVVAADEGVMPQTREHLEICQLLGIRRGVVALTKSDRAAGDLVELALEDVRSAVAGSFLEGAPILPCSALTGAGIDALREALAQAARAAAAERVDAGADVALLPIDRTFSVRGFGTVVTGTLLRGALAVGDEVAVIPAIPGKAIEAPVRIRSLQSFGAPRERAVVGERTAVNLQGVDLDHVRIGQVLATPGAAVATRKIAVELTYLRSRSRTLASGARVLFHSGTALVEGGVTLIGRDALEPGEKAFARVLLRQPIATLPGERFIARGFDAATQAGRTVAGGVIVDVCPGRRRRQAPETMALMTQLLAQLGRVARREHLEQALVALVKERGAAGLSRASLAQRVGRPLAEIQRALAGSGGLVEIGEQVVERGALEALAGHLEAQVEAFQRAHPFAPGMTLAELIASARAGAARRVVPAIVSEHALGLLLARGGIVREGELVRRAGRQMNAASLAARTRILAVLDAAGLEPPAPAVLEAKSGLSGAAFRDLLGSMARAGEVVHPAPDLYYGREAIAGVEARVLAHLAAHGALTTAEAKAMLGLSRKYLIPLLEALDRLQITVRVGEVRKARVRRGDARSDDRGPAR